MANELSRQSLSVKKQADKPSVIQSLEIFEEQVKSVSTDYLQTVKQSTLLMLSAAKRSLQTCKPSEAKLVRRHSEEMSKEFKRLSRVMSRGGTKND